MKASMECPECGLANPSSVGACECGYVLKTDAVPEKDMTELEVIWHGKSDEELATATAQIEDYTPEAQHVVRAEVARRGLILSPAAEQTSEEEPSQVPTPVYFPVTSAKLILLCITSLGLYELYWFYKHWSFEKARTKERISPFWRTVFAPFFAFSLFGRISELSAAESFKHLRHFSHSDSVACAGMFFALTLSARLPGPLWIVSLFSFVPLLTVQRAVNRINKMYAPEADPNSRFGMGNIVVVALGGILVLMAIV